VTRSLLVNVVSNNKMWKGSSSLRVENSSSKYSNGASLYFAISPGDASSLLESFVLPNPPLFFRPVFFFVFSRAGATVDMENGEDDMMLKALVVDARSDVIVKIRIASFIFAGVS